MQRELDVGAFLRHLPLFAGLGADDIARVAAGTTRKRLRRGEVLFRRGERPTGFYAVVHGRIALTADAARGRERVTDIIEAGRSFGEAVMFLDKPCIVGARALTDALILHVAKDTVFAEIERSPGFARRIIAALSAKLQASVRELDTYALGSGARRFAAWLLRSVRGGEASVTLPGSKRDIASTLNLSPEHLSRILGELAGDGLIDVRGRRIAIPDVPRLREWAGHG